MVKVEPEKPAIPVSALAQDDCFRLFKTVMPGNCHPVRSADNGTQLTFTGHAKNPYMGMGMCLMLSMLGSQINCYLADIQPLQ